MKYGFVIDNTRCIGCHACTVACKSEHDIPVGVNRTWVKYVEKGSFPDTRRLFSVMRCNHCEDSPCADICPTSALFNRTDGIVDFNNDRCIGCKACMQACPYDALYIDPETSTAAKCNYCAHRVDVGLEPACVNVCPTNAIISGDLDNEGSVISKTIARNQVTVRKGEKATKPKLFYIDGDEASIKPINTEVENNYLWSDQSKGVGHHAGKQSDGKVAVVDKGMDHHPTKPALNLAANDARRVYDSPAKGILWGWEVAGYIFTKAIAAGVLPLALLFNMLGLSNFSDSNLYLFWGISLLFLGLTGLLLVKDLDQPKRFLYVLLRPHFNSWLVKGAYIITGYGAFMSLWLGIKLLEINTGSGLFVVEVLVLGFALLTSIYTAFLFAQAKGRDFWQSPMLVFNMFTHTLIGSAAVVILLALLSKFVSSPFLPMLSELNMNSSSGMNQGVNSFIYLLFGGILVHLGMVLSEWITPHPTTDSKITMEVITKGIYKNQFRYGVIGTGILLPLIMFGLWIQGQGSGTFGGGTMGDLSVLPILTGLTVTSLIGMWYSIKTWVYAPQTIQLS